MVYLGLGANLGDREANLTEAVRRLRQSGIQVEACSSLYETEPVGYAGQPRFLNAACQAKTDLTPEQLLKAVKDIEREMGRVPSFPNAPRPIDIDMLFYGDLVMDTPDLIIPHPRLAERAFVLTPLAEIAPEVVHPVLKAAVADLLAKVSGREGVRKREAPTSRHGSTTKYTKYSNATALPPADDLRV